MKSLGLPNDGRLQAFLFLFFAVPLFLPLPLPLFFSYGGFAFLAALCQVDRRGWAYLLRRVAPFLLAIALLSPPFYREGEVLLSFRGVTVVTKPGLLFTVRFLTRFFGISLLLAVYSRLVTLSRFLLTMVWFRLPYGAALTVMLTLKMLGDLQGLHGQICQAHKLRSPRGHFFSHLVTLFVEAIKKVTTLSMALEIRGLGNRQERSFFYRLPPLREAWRREGLSFVALLLLWMLPFLCCALGEFF